MTNTNLSNLSLGLHSLCVFRDLLFDPVVSKLLKLLDCIDGEKIKTKVDAYSDFVSELYKSKHSSLGDYIQNAVNNNENPYVKALGRKDAVSESLKNSVVAELNTLQAAANLTSRELVQSIGCEIRLAEFESKKTNLSSDYFCRTSNISKYGYGIYARYHMLRIDGENKIVPVINPDTTRLSQLIDYKREQQIIIDNTKALLCGKPAANILLTGDAGTGKSSTVKAVVNELCSQGLRIIEVRKEQLHSIPEILDELSENPLKFILFIDDLSFQKDDDNFSALKAVLEGSVCAKSENVVIYATSNRRHLVKEKFSDREGDDVHFNDTMQEIVSLSERFGIQITFNRPDKKTYLDIVRHLAEDNGIKYDESLEMLAERFALSRGKRSARAAKQFVDSFV